MNFFERDRYFAPAARYTLGKPAPEFVSAPNRTFSRVCTGPGMTKGRTNGMPWDGTSPCTASTVIDPPKALPVPRACVDTPVTFWNLERLWEMPDNPWIAMSWLGLSSQLEEMAGVIADPEFAGELQLLADVAYQHWLDA